MDEALDAAAGTGDVVRTWLHISMSREESDLYRALLLSFTEGGTDTSELLRMSAEASTRWERLLAEELGDPIAGSVVRLLGDGLVMTALTGETLPSLESILYCIPCLILLGLGIAHGDRVRLRLQKVYDRFATGTIERSIPTALALALLGLGMLTIAAWP